MDFLQLCADRYSVRSFADTPIPDEVLDGSWRRAVWLPLP